MSAQSLLQTNVALQQSVADVSTGILQRRCDCGNHTIAGGTCEQCQNKTGVLQRKSSNNSQSPEVPPIVHEVLNSSGRPLDESTRAFFESRFAHNFSRVPVSSASRQMSPNRLAIGESTDVYEQEADRVADSVMRKSENKTLPTNKDAKFDLSRVRIHTDSRAAESAHAVNALAYTVGNNIVFGAGQFTPGSHAGRRLIAHELTHVAQQNSQANRSVLQRKVLLSDVEMEDTARNDFIKQRDWAKPELAAAIMDDMAESADPFDFDNEDELESEISKRTTNVEYMKESQEDETDPSTGKVLAAFGYPFSKKLPYGPRVNYAAKDYWQPVVPDDYAVRNDPVKNAQLRALQKAERCIVYGDQCTPGYQWALTKDGMDEPYLAFTLLFVKQPLPRRTLIHCDYLTSAIHFLTLAESIGPEKFKEKLVAYGLRRIRLRSDTFAHLLDEIPSLTGQSKKGMGALQLVTPSSESDLVIGDHVIFYNHLAFDLLNEKIGNAWRSENAILIEKKKGEDIFLGHGSGRKNDENMRLKLAQEYNNVAGEAMALTVRADAKDPQALKKLKDKFPNVVQDGKQWKVRGQGICANKPVDEDLRKIKGSEVVGLRNQCYPERMLPVKRPIESAK